MAQELDFSNPFAVIVGFFAITLTALVYILRFVPIFFAEFGVVGAIGGLFLSVGLLFRILVGD